MIKISLLSKKKKRREIQNKDREIHSIRRPGDLGRVQKRGEEVRSGSLKVKGAPRGEF